jgi:hypothetical protein
MSGSRDIAEKLLKMNNPEKLATHRAHMTKTNKTLENLPMI